MSERRNLVNFEEHVKELKGSVAKGINRTEAEEIRL